MDRSDESRLINDTDESPSRSHSGDILGLGGAPVPKMPGDPSASDDPESVRRRRERAMEDEDSREPRLRESALRRDRHRHGRRRTGHGYQRQVAKEDRLASWPGNGS